MYLAKIYVTLKPGVLDPQGSAVCKAVHAMGYAVVEDVRIGKYMEMRLKGSDRVRLEAEVGEMCRRLLANPVIEKYEFSLVEVTS